MCAQLVKECCVAEEQNEKPQRVTTEGSSATTGSTTEQHTREQEQKGPPYNLEQNKFDKTIAIDTKGVGTTEFNLSEVRVKVLYESGREEAEEFLNKIESG
jgi:hypothetical protein